MNVHCPRCHNEIGFSGNRPPAEMRCDSCGTKFVRPKAETISFTEVNGHPVRGFATFVSTQGGKLRHGKTLEYYQSSGKKAREFEYEYGSIRKRTIWRLDGSIQYQQAADGSRRRDPPFWWGKEPEVKPSAPWWKPDRKRPQ